AAEVEEHARLGVVGERARAPLELAAPAVEAVDGPGVGRDVQPPAEERRARGDLRVDLVAPHEVPAGTELHRVDGRVAPTSEGGEEEPGRDDPRGWLVLLSCE